MREEPLSIFANSKSSPNEIANAVLHLGPVREPASFWAQIANDPGYSALHRQHAVVQLFRRHVRPGLTLRELAALLDGPNWITAEEVSEVKIVLGLIPVALTAEDTVFLLQVLPNISETVLCGVYLRVQGSIQKAAFVEILLSRAQDPEIDARTLLEIGIFFDQGRTAA